MSTQAKQAPPRDFQEWWARMGSMPNIGIELDPRSAWLLMGAIQLAWRHPDHGAAMREILWRLGHAVEASFRHDPVGARYAAMGWEVEYDQPASVSGEENYRV